MLIVPCPLAIILLFDSGAFSLSRSVLRFIMEGSLSFSQTSKAQLSINVQTYVNKTSAALFVDLLRWPVLKIQESSPAGHVPGA